VQALKSGKDVTITATANADNRFAAQITVKVTAKEQAVDKSKLQSAVDEAGKLNEKDYTADSWKAFAGQLESAKKVLADANATQADVDAAAKALADAQSKLVKTGDDNGSGNNGSNSQSKLSSTGTDVAMAAAAVVLLAAGGATIALLRRREAR